MLRFSMFAGIGCALALASSASADPGNGAQHITYSVCFPSPGLYQQCYVGDTLANQTFNGNTVTLFTHEDVVGTFTGAPDGPFGGCSQTTQSTSKLHYVFRNDAGTPQVYSFKGSGFQVGVNCFGEPSQVCTFTSRYHYANGLVRHERSEQTCTPL